MVRVFIRAFWEVNFPRNVSRNICLFSKKRIGVWNTNRPLMLGQFVAPFQTILMFFYPSILQRISHGLKWENKLPKLKRFDHHMA